MKKIIFIVVISVLCQAESKAQSAAYNKGINFQGVARNNNGLIISNKVINLRLSILTDTLNGNIEYQEIKSITTNVLGLFSVIVGGLDPNKIITLGPFENINWSVGSKYLHVEVDITGDLFFLDLGIQKINYVPYAFYADKVEGKNIIGLVGIKQGGTGFDNLKDVKTNLGIDKITNTPDSLKTISQPTLLMLNEKLKKVDTLYLHNRINLKLNSADTLKLSQRINQKFNAADTTFIYQRMDELSKMDTINLSNRINLKLSKTDTSSLSNRINIKLSNSDTIRLSNRSNYKLNKIDTTNLSNRINLKLFNSDTMNLSNRIDNKISKGTLTSLDIINALEYTPSRDDYGSFYDTAKQSTLIATATAVKFTIPTYFNNIKITNNTSGSPTRITVTHPGIYQVNYALQVLKLDMGNDDLSVWIRRNSAALANTNNSFIINGAGIKNNITASFYVELGLDDYVELFYSIKNASTTLVSTVAQSSPSRPATPSALITIHRVN